MTTPADHDKRCPAAWDTSVKCDCGAADLPEALRLADWLQNTVATYPQMSEDEPGGYCQEVDQVMDQAAAELRRLHNESVEAHAGYRTEQYWQGWNAALAAGQAVAPAEQLHITHGPLMRHAAALLRSRKPVLPDHEGVAAELERAVDGHPTPSGAPSAEWLEVARIAEQQILEAAEKAGLWPNTVHSWIPAFHRYHKELAKAQSAPARADSVLEDAARYQWLRDSPIANNVALAEHFGGSRLQDFDAAIDAARKQGANHD